MEAAFFDVDKTVIARASIAAFGRPLYRGGLISRSTVLRALTSQFVYLHLGASEHKLDRVREQVLALIQGWDRDTVSKIVRETLDQVIEPIIFAEALDLIEHHQHEGRQVFLVSTAPEEIVLPLAEYIGANGAIATRAVVDDLGRYTGEVDFYAYGPFKAEAIVELAEARGIDLAASYAYSDSYTDAPMLEAVGHPVAVNPDRVLARVARARGWETLTFSRPVRLRDRVPTPSLPVTAVATGAAVAMGAAWIAWRMVQRPGGAPALNAPGS